MQHSAQQTRTWVDRIPSPAVASITMHIPTTAAIAQSRMPAVSMILTVSMFPCGRMGGAYLGIATPTGIGRTMHGIRPDGPMASHPERTYLSRESGHRS